MKKMIFIISVVLLGILAAGAYGQDADPQAPESTSSGPVIRQSEREVFRTFGPQGQWGREDFAGGRGEERIARRLMAALDNDRVKAYLNLTDPQVDRLRQIMVNAEKSGVKTRADMAVRGIELRELLRADKPDRDAVLRKVQELSILRGEMAKERVEALLDAKSVLTPEQQKRIRSFIENRRAFGGGRHGARGEGMGFGPGRLDRAPRPPAPPAHPGEPPLE